MDFRRREILALLAVLALAAVVRTPGLLSRGIWYDEAISLLETSGHAEPQWPSGIAPASASKDYFTGSVSLSQLTEDLRRTDVHPPLYFWALALWRAALGFDIATARALSLLFSLGSILMLYLLLRFADYEHPIGATVVYTLATGAVHNGHEARPYALAVLLLLMAVLFGFLAVHWAPRDRARATAGSIAMAICCGAVFATNYLSLFSVGALLLWYLWHLWSVSRLLALAGPLLSVLCAGLTVPLLFGHLGARDEQFSGFAGPIRELLALIRMNAQQSGVALSLSGLDRSEITRIIPTVTTVSVILILVGLTLATLKKNWCAAPRRLWLLLFGLALSPTVGIFLLDLAFDKRLHQSRYLSLALPAVAVLVAHGVLAFGRTRPRWGVLVFGALLAVQATRLNWGFERCVRDQTGTLTRGVAAMIEDAEAAPSRVVALAAGHGRGDPASWIYELAPDTPVLVYGLGDDMAQVTRAIDGHADVWITFSSDKETFLMERELIRRLEESGRYTTIFYNRLIHRLVRTTWP